jgi:ankyrin repeat protein
MIAMVSDDVDLNNQAVNNGNNNSNDNDEKDDRFADNFFSLILESNAIAIYPTIKSFVDAGENVNYVSQGGETPLHVAAAYSSPRTVSWLLEKRS